MPVNIEIIAPQNERIISITDLNFRDNVLISKEKYKHLVDQSVELIKQKILNKKLKEVIEKKAAQLNALKRTISQHEYLLKRKEAIEDEDRKRSEYVHEKKASECSVNIN